MAIRYQLGAISISEQAELPSLAEKVRAVLRRAMGCVAAFGPNVTHNQDAKSAKRLAHKAACAPEAKRVVHMAGSEFPPPMVSNFRLGNVASRPDRHSSSVVSIGVA